MDSYLDISYDLDSYDLDSYDLDSYLGYGQDCTAGMGTTGAPSRYPGEEIR